MKKTIGLQITDIETGYNKSLWKNLITEVQTRGMNLIIFPGLHAKEPYFGTEEFSSLYNLISSESVDALILCAETLNNYLPREEYEVIVKEINKSVPVVFLGDEIEDIPSIVVNNKKGVKEAVKHLISEHGKRNIAMVLGHLENKEAQERYLGYEEALTEQGIELNSKLLFRGDFNRSSGVDAAEYYLEYGINKIDAIMVSSDEMAIGLTQTLQKNGILIPEDLSIIGFDDIEEAPFQPTPLATVRQPLYDRAKTAVIYAEQLINGQNPPNLTTLDTTLIPRLSCGCFKQLKEWFSTRWDIPGDVREKLHALIEEKYKGMIPLGDEQKLGDYLEKLTAILMEVNSWDLVAQTFLQYLSHVLLRDNEHTLKRIRVDWNELLQILYFESRRNAPLHHQWLEMNLFQKASMIIARKMEQYHGADRISNHHNILIPLREYSQQLNSCIYEEEVYKILKEMIKTFDIGTAFLSLYKMGKQIPCILSEMPETSELKLYMKNNKLEQLPENPQFKTMKLSPFNDLFEGRSGVVFIAQPLFFLKEKLGFLIMEYKDQKSIIFESIRLYISTALKNTLLLTDKKIAEKRLKEALSDLEEYNIKLREENILDHLTGLLNRKGFMKKATELLEQTIQQNESYILFFFDLDRLKQINDSDGHEMGDLAIKSMADILKKVLNDPSFLISRLGGDEFVALVTGVDEHFAHQTRKSLLKELDLFNRDREKPFILSFSTGTASSFQGHTDSDLHHLLYEADQALYKAKKSRILTD